MTEPGVKLRNHREKLLMNPKWRAQATKTNNATRDTKMDYEY